jgi:hypothetical protein
MSPSSPSKRPIPTTAHPEGERSERIEGSTWTAVRHAAVGTLLAIAALLLTAAPAAATTATLDANGNFVVDGAPVFPIGIYHVSWIGGRQGNAAQVADFDAIADAGFTLVHPTVDLRPGMAVALDRAAARGLWVIAEIPWAAAEDVIALWRDRPAIIGWNIADDFNAPYSGPPNHPPAELAARRDFVAVHAPQHLTYASGGSFPGFEIDAYAGTVGVMGFQSYPIDGQSTPTEYELQENVDGFDYVAAQLAPSGQTFVANPQSFKWQGGDFPTPQEARNLLYPPLLRGAKGVFFYTYWGENGVLATADPALWAELRREVAELKTLAPFLLGASPQPLATGDPRVHGATWQHDNQIVAVLLNTHRSDTYAVSVALPAVAQHGPALPLFPLRAEAGMNAAASQLSGSIGPLDVHVYLIDVGVAGNLSPSAAANVAPPAIGAGEPLTFDASASSDGDGAVVEWRWDFGDGAGAAGAIVEHTYPTAGPRVARLTVRDDDGAPATLFVPIDVQLTSLCPPAPLAGCRAASGSSLAITETRRRTLKWKWTGAATSAAEFGDPTADTRYALCVYDAAGRALATTALPSATRWRQSASGDLRFTDGTGQPGGITKIKLHPGPSGRARLQVLAKSAALPSASLPLDLPVTVQAVRSGGGPCWTATYTGSQSNTGTRFRAR